jgi:hypothetical protein
VRRWFAAIAVIALGATGLFGPGIAAGDQSRAQLRSSDCHEALDPQDRSISVKAVMRPLPGTQKLQLKFDLLLGHDGSSAQSSVHAGNLGTWLSPRNPTLGQVPADVWNFKKSIFQLDAPAIYRFKVSFRWLGSGGRVIGSAVHYTKRCRQGELRPDLLVGPITITASGNQDIYSTVIRNAGATAAGPFTVLFADGEKTPPQQRVQRLAPYTSRGISFTGPRCDPTAPPTIIADQYFEVDDLNRANNSVTAVCPTAGTG